jgi:hypothetical protein
VEESTLYSDGNSISGAGTRVRRRGVTRRRNVREKGNFSSDYRPERMTEQPPLLLLLPFFKSNKKRKANGRK